MSQAEFARHRGVSKAIVTKWKGQGLVSLTDDGKVDVDATEWNLDQRPATYRGGTTHRPVRAIPQDDELAGKPARPAAAPRPAPPAPEPVNDEAGSDPAEIDWDDPNLPPNLALQRKENYLGLLRKQDHGVKQGALVDRAAAEAAFFKEARAMRDAWIAWPARVAIEMADALKIDARELTQVLSDYVNKHLAELGEPSDLDLSRHQQS
ncbi:UNVERIFIED_CONTAM: hypothetical protein Q9R58_28770 [Methylobacteriaceae bacterium AG10]|nr:hypothetical protein [Methylobacteriaceae bacterium AG10]